MKAKKLLVVLLAIGFVLALCTMSVSAQEYSGGWEWGYIDGSYNYYWEDANGNILKNQWIEYDNNRYYVGSNGVRYSEGIYKIDEKMYAFNYDGVMYSSELFEMYFEGKSSYFYAHENGVLAQNEWVEAESYGSTNQYYFVDDCRGADGLKTVDGKQYFFSSGQLITYYEYSNAHRHYDENNVVHFIIIDKNNYAVEVKNNNWACVDDEWYYVQNDEFCYNGTYKINGKWYGFDYHYKMYSGTMFDVYDNDLGEWVYYYAYDSGELAINEWILVEEDYSGEFWYYYGENGKAPYGPKTIDGQLYYFHSNGQMATGGAFIFEKDGAKRFFVVDEEGNAKEVNNNQWVYNGKKWYYVQDGEFCTSGVYKIGGKLYGFNYLSQMYEAVTFSYYDQENNKEIYCYAHSDGVLAENEWVSRGSSWFYYGNNGEAPYGFSTVDGKQYFFSHGGLMCSNGAFTHHDYSGSTTVKYFVICDEDGIATEAKNNEWTFNSGDWYYVQNENFCTNGIYTIDGKLYGFDYNSKMYADKSFDMYNSDLGGWVYSYAHSNGVLAQDEWIFRNSEWYYYNEYGQAYKNCMEKVGDKYYYFGYDGYVYSDTTFYDEKSGKYYYATPINENGNGGYVSSEKNVWKAVNGEWVYLSADSSLHVGPLNGYFMTPYMVYASYYTAEDGYAYVVKGNGSAEKLTYTGWVMTGFDYIYTVNGKYVKNDWKKIDNKWYYFNSYGEMYYNDAYQINGKCYYFDAKGVMQSNGWIQAGDSWYYANSEGELVAGDWKKIDGIWYYFSEYGYMYSDGHYYINDKFYYFLENGAMASNTWIKGYGGDWFWATSSGELLTGKSSDGYLFDYNGCLVVDRTYFYDGYNYITNKDGKIIYTFTKDGWHNVGGNWYYVGIDYYDNEIYLYTGCGTDIDDAYYAFDDDGKMITNDFEYSRYYGKDGKAVSGWFQVDGYWYYGDSGDRYLATEGIIKIGGKEFAFDRYSKLIVNKTVILNNRTIRTNSNGEVVTNISANGWAYESEDSSYGEVLYYVNGKRYTGWVGNYYISDGYMVYNTTIEVDNKQYYIDAKGLCLTPGWHEVYKNHWVYVKSDYSLVCNDWLNLGGTWYYFSGLYMVYDRNMSIKGEIHSFNKDGVWTGELSGIADGWKKIGSDWYYFNAGEPVSAQLLYIDGAYYFFDSYGKMVSNGFYYVNGGICYFAASGELMQYTGWQKINNKWVYFNAFNRVSSRVIENGKEYYIIREQIKNTINSATKYDVYMAASTYRVVNDTLCYYNADGVLTSKYTTNGWKKVGSDWYYINNGYVCTYYTLKEYGAEYFFDGSGKMVTDEVYDYDYWTYYGKDGKAVRKQGWHKTGDNKWIYVKEDGYLAANGIFLIDGVEYAFEGGYWVE